MWIPPLEELRIYIGLEKNKDEKALHWNIYLVDFEGFQPSVNLFLPSVVWVVNERYCPSINLSNLKEIFLAGHIEETYMYTYQTTFSFIGLQDL